MAWLDEYEQGDGAADGKRLYGAYVAVVTDIKDPDKQGRVKIRLPWSPDEGDGAYEVWARLATMMGGNQRGTWFVPDPKDEVLVMFEGGSPRRPYVVGGLWNGKDAPPESMDKAGKNYKKSIVSRNNIRITLDDTDGKETLTLRTPAGQRIVMMDGDKSIEVTDANGSTVRMDGQGVTVTTSQNVTVDAKEVEVTAGKVTVNAGMSKFSGTIECSTINAGTVHGGTYLPGIGQIW